MDIDTPGGELLTDSGGHAHLIWIPGFSKSFPLPFRVLTLLGLGILCWALNLQLLRYLGIDVNRVLLRSGGATRTDGERPTMEDSVSISSDRGADRALYHSVYRIFLVYSLWVGIGWCFFRWATGGQEESINRFRVVPFILFMGAVIFVFSPYSFEKHTRESFLRSIRRCFIPSTHQPTRFADVIFADVFTSFAKVFGDLWISFYQIFWVAYITSIPPQTGIIQLIVPIMMSVPYFIRLRQCCIDYFSSDGRSKRQLWNALKYATAFPVIFLSSAQTIVIADLIREMGEARVLGTLWHGEHTLFRLWILAVFVNSTFSFWWDVTNDWGLAMLEPSLWASILWPDRTHYRSLGQDPALELQSRLSPGTHPIQHLRSYSNRTPELSLEDDSLPAPATSTASKARGPEMYIHPNGSASKLSRAFGLRPRLLFRRPIVYYVVIGLNLVLRLTWSLKLSSHLHNVAEFGSGVFLMEALEILRRWMWVFFRVEWEVVRRSEDAANGGLDDDDYELRGQLGEGAVMFERKDESYI